MTIEEAIKKAEGIAEEKFNNAVHIMDKMKSDIALENAEEYKRCAEEHRQLAEWLTEYKQLLEQEPKWIPIITRKPTEEEKKDYFEQNGEELCYMIDSPMPDNGQEVLVSVGNYVSEDVFDEDFYNFEGHNIEDIDAWMPKPKPYKVESEKTWQN